MITAKRKGVPVRDTRTAERFFNGNVLADNCVSVLCLAKRDGVDSMSVGQIAKLALAGQSGLFGRELNGSDILATGEALRGLEAGEWVVKHGMGYTLHSSVTIKIDDTLDPVSPIGTLSGVQILSRHRLAVHSGKESHECHM